MSAVAEVETAASPDTAALNLVDEQHPWLGLDSFSEETRQFFHGREEEVGELARRVQRKTLTILFGQSGLGKTSILRAGIVPRLRKEGYCPVYVRIDYSRESPAPSQQIKQAIFRATEALGKWTKPGSAVPGESLWEFLHHRDDFLKDNGGNTLVPLVIFDQFEEIFTLGQMDDFGRARATEFIEDLADLVENRPPRAIESMLETEESIVERFDFNRADYRILIALREDYLAHLEGLKASMPSITQNRMRLARMTGHQALAAVVKPGGKLVSEEVAESIVRFVAGGSELRNAEVEPSLLSLVCRELNNTRIAQGRAEISADLLAGSRDTILNEFYERALSDQPPGVRRFIEDEMLTESGFRESLAEERVLRGFTAANAMPSALPLLVNRRLLRIEERLDARRVEITHDVLCAVVKASRGERHAREAQEEAERQLAAQRAREEATKKSLVRTRWVAVVCAVLAVGALASAVFGYQSMKRAQEAEAKALATHQMAESARGEAEKLVVYLLDDFYVELEPIGRLDIVADLSKRALDYYSGLPPQLRTPQTDRNRALALVRYGYVLRYQGKLDESSKVLTEANDVLAKLRREGDRSEMAAVGHALGLNALGRVVDSQGGVSKALPYTQQSVDILRPLAMEASASTTVRNAFARSMNYHGFVQMRTGNPAEAVKTFDLTRETYRSIDGLKVGDLASAAGYAETAAWLMEAHGVQGHKDDARKVGEDGLAVATRVVEKSPAHMGAMRSRALIGSGLARAYIEDHNPKRGQAMAQSAMRDWESLVKADPGNTIAWGNLGVARYWYAWALRYAGDMEGGLAVLKGTLEFEKRAAQSPQLYSGLGTASGWVSVWEAELGRRAESRASMAEMRRFREKFFGMIGKDAFPRFFTPIWVQRFETMIAEAEGDHPAMRESARKTIALAEALKTINEGQQRSRDELLAAGHSLHGASLYYLRDYAGAEKALREALRVRAGRPVLLRQNELERSYDQALLALSLARQGKLEPARAAVAPALEFQESLRARGSQDVDQLLQLALTLYAAAVASPPRAPELLAEATRTLDNLPVKTRVRKDATRLRGWIGEEMARKPAA